MVHQVAAHHLSRLACLYVRQSTLHQVFENTESTALLEVNYPSTSHCLMGESYSEKEHASWITLP